MNKAIADIKVTAGIDEAGRGPLAGPLFAACVVLPKRHGIKGIDDSKKLTSRQRDRLYDEIKEKTYFHIAKCSHKYIDKHGLRKACREVFKKAYKGLLKKYPELQVQELLIDGRDNFKFDMKATYIIGGDGKIPAIGAASILAKVARDRYMARMHEKYPLYEFLQHKGYGTRLHRDLIQKNGPCEIHRKSFAPVKDMVE
mgnify:CR=1 FL=1